MDLSEVRREYLKGGLRSSDLPNEPFALLEKWMTQAKDLQMLDPTAMVVATVDANGQPYQRIVLLKRFDKNGFVFFTNLESRKAQHLEGNNKVNLLFPWHNIERQVAITGHATKLSTAEVLKYFVTRPKESQIAAWVSKQSHKLTARQALEIKFKEMKQKFAEGDVPLPKFWGGYIVKPESIEFWQGGEHRLHDRFLYTKDHDDWNIDRLAP
ncbi:pyridoxamine 5'-phosphate oxidase [Shewanella sp. OPT22]|nr:pyridoxamine 5'-phosphate oxidase [Shewanella sp. OPT22]